MMRLPFLLAALGTITAIVLGVNFNAFIGLATYVTVCVILFVWMIVISGTPWKTLFFGVDTNEE